MNTVLSTKGQIVIPAELRHRDKLVPGQSFAIERVDRGEYRLVAADPPKNHGLVDTLLACPENGWFVPIESESTDSLG
ncbi:MAG: AbrB/MazE/SpoVT family DNA-binding domain-containing protein [Gemmatimonadota bacterium]|nr:AbrB/MazE/SpoVT family DNA-binding domain-containing protein [Gemmatimonadota bacterium]